MPRYYGYVHRQVLGYLADSKRDTTLGKVTENRYPVGITHGFEKFRGKQFIDREEEINFFISYFNQLPEQILFVYGPKSSGKTTLIEYVVEEKLLKGKKFWKDKAFNEQSAKNRRTRGLWFIGR